jgi:hypothetical protein
LLLDGDAKQTSILKTKLRKLYDIRSAIVHGGFEVIHPMNHDVLDERASDEFGNLLSAMEIGYSVIKAAIQTIAENGWPDLRFDEVIALQR